MSNHIAVLGAGRWGTLLAWLLHFSHRVVLWDRNKDKEKTLNQKRRNEYGVVLPPSIHITSNMNEAVKKASLVLVAINSQGVRDLCKKQLARFSWKNTIIVSAMKGIEQPSGKRMSELFSELIEAKHTAILAGPGHTENIIKRKKTALVAASRDKRTLNILRRAFRGSSWIHLTYTHDVVGVELGGAFKNVVGIAAGICDGRDEEDLKALIIDKSLEEIIRLGKKLGAKSETFYGLSFLGDLYVTCFGEHSKNRKFGEQFSLEKFSRLPNNTPEGVATTKSFNKLSKRTHTSMPICEFVYNILYKNKNPDQALKEIWHILTGNN